MIALITLGLVVSERGADQVVNRVVDRAAGETVDGAADEAVTQAMIASALTQPCTVIFKRSTTSTNDDAKTLLRDDTAAAREIPVGIVSYQQSAGRGRLGRTWESPRGSGYLSLLLRPSVQQSMLAPLSLVVALGVSDAFCALGVKDVQVKWPNDVLDTCGKLSGILLETVMAEPQAVVVGVGINVSRPVDAVYEGASYLSDTHVPPPLESVIACVIDSILSRYGSWVADGHRFDSFIADYESILSLNDQWVTVRKRDGTPLAEGAVYGVNAEGCLLLRRDGVCTAVSSGDVTLRPF